MLNLTNVDNPVRIHAHLKGAPAGASAKGPAFLSCLVDTRPPHLPHVRAQGPWTPSVSLSNVQSLRKPVSRLLPSFKSISLLSCNMHVAKCTAHRPQPDEIQNTVSIPESSLCPRLPSSHSPPPPSTFSAFITIKQFHFGLNYIYMESYSGSLASFAHHCVCEIHPSSFFCPQLF